MADGKITIEFDAEIAHLKKQISDAKRVLDTMKKAEAKNNKAIIASEKKIASLQKEQEKNFNSLSAKRKAVFQAEDALRQTSIAKRNKADQIAKKQEFIRLKEQAKAEADYKRRDYLDKASRAKTPEKEEYYAHQAKRQVQIWDNADRAIKLAQKDLLVYDKEIGRINQKEAEQKETLTATQQAVAQVLAEYSRISAELEKENTTHSGLKEKAIELANLLRVQEGIIGRLVNKQLQLNLDKKDAVAQAKEEAEAEAEAKRKAEERKRTIKNILSTLQGIAKTTLKTAFNIAKWPLKKILSLSNKLPNPFKKLSGVIKKASKAMHSFGKRIKNAVIQGLLLRPIREGFYGIYEALSNATKQSSEFQVALANLKGTLWTALAPAFEAILPIIVKVMNALATLISYLSALAGAFFKLKPASKEAGKGLSDLSKKGTGEKDDNLDFASWDTVQQLHKKSGGAEAPEIDPTFEQDFQAAEDAFASLRQAILDDDWFEAGAIIGQKLNTIIESMNTWIVEKFTPFVNTFAANLASLLNGMNMTVNFPLIGTAIANGLNGIFGAFNTFFIDFDSAEFGARLGSAVNSFTDDIDGPLLGETVANGLNSIISAVHGFFTTFEGEKFGTKFAEIFNSLIEEINWDNIGLTFSEGLNDIIDAFNNFFINADTYAMGASIGSAVMKAIETINWETLGETLSNLVNRIFNALKGFFDEYDGREVGARISATVNKFFKNLDAKDIGSTLSAYVTDCYETLIGFIEGVDWEEVGRTVKEFITGIEWDKVADALFETVGAAIGGLGAFLWGIIEDEWEDCVNWWVDLLNEEDGKAFVDGLCDGIVSALTGIGTWIKEHIFDPFMEGFRKAFGIHSPSTVMEEQGDYIVDGMLGGILSGLSSIGTWIHDNIFKPIIDNVKKFFGTESGQSTEFSTVGWDLISGLFGGITSGLSGVGEWIKTNIFDPIISKVLEFFGIQSGQSTEFSTVGWDLISGLFGGVSAALSDVGEWVRTNIFDPIFGKILELFGIDAEDSEQMKKAGKAIANGLTSGIETAKEKIKGVINGIIDIVERGINWIIRKLNKFHVDAPDWVKEKFGVDGFGFSLDEIRIPRLAQGGVVNPGHQFAAVLGDNRREQEIVSPLSTMKQALMEALQESGATRTGPITLQLDGVTFARVATPYMRNESVRLGTKAIGGDLR